MNKFEEVFFSILGVLAGLLAGFIIGIAWVPRPTKYGESHWFYDVPEFWAGVLAVVAAFIAGSAIRDQTKDQREHKEKEIRDKIKNTAAIFYSELKNNFVQFGINIHEADYIASINVDKRKTAASQIYHKRVLEQLIIEAGSLPQNTCDKILETYLDTEDAHSHWITIINDLTDKNFTIDPQTSDDERIKIKKSFVAKIVIFNYRKLRYKTAIAMKELCKTTGHNLDEEADKIIKENPNVTDFVSYLITEQ